MPGTAKAKPRTAKIPKLSEEATAAYDEFLRQQKKQNTARKLADRSKSIFVAAFGDPPDNLVELADGRRVRKVTEARDGYRVPPFNSTRYVVEPPE